MIYDEIDSLFMDFDPEQLEKIVSNLLSNAIKNTPADGTIILHVSRKIPGESANAESEGQRHWTS
ncbi:MAG: ATP-binding protein [Bacteroidales bacterium]|nr:ATP-binding protein [Bacteroidales bacterium]